MEIKKKSVVPVYGFAIVWVIYCLLFPLFKTIHFIILSCVSVLSYIILSAKFPGTTEYQEIPVEPVRTGNELIDALLEEGEKAVIEMTRVCAGITNDELKTKVRGIITVTDKIFKNLHDDPGDYKQVKRFSDFYLPTTIKLLSSYDRAAKSETQGQNVTDILSQIDSVLDTILDSYEKFFDSLFENQVLDIETDIVVLESILKREGLLDSDFNSATGVTS